MLSPSLEDYMEEVYRMSITKKDIRIIDIAKTLNVSKPSVVKGFKKLDSLGFIKYRPYEKILITQSGLRKGKFLCERNLLLRKFIKIIGSESDEYKEAEAMEHFFTIDTICCIEKLVSFFENNQDILRNFEEYIFISEFKNKKS